MLFYNFAYDNQSNVVKQIVTVIFVKIPLSLIFATHSENPERRLHAQSGLDNLATWAGKNELLHLIWICPLLFTPFIQLDQRLRPLDRSIYLDLKVTQGKHIGQK
jgi:hypothetical protein